MSTCFLGATFFQLFGKLVLNDICWASPRCYLIIEVILVGFLTLLFAAGRRWKWATSNSGTSSPAAQRRIWDCAKDYGELSTWDHQFVARIFVSRFAFNLWHLKISEMKGFCACMTDFTHHISILGLNANLTIKSMLSIEAVNSPLSSYSMNHIVITEKLTQSYVHLGMFPLLCIKESLRIQNLRALILCMSSQDIKYFSPMKMILPVKGCPKIVSCAGSSSGLHHDFHDNLYVLLHGCKSFCLWSPSEAEQMYTHGRIIKVYPNGRIIYEGQVI